MTAVSSASSSSSSQWIHPMHLVPTFRLIATNLTQVLHRESRRKKHLHTYPQNEPLSAYLNFIKDQCEERVQAPHPLSNHSLLLCVDLLLPGADSGKVSRQTANLVHKLVNQAFFSAYSDPVYLCTPPTGFLTTLLLPSLPEEGQTPSHCEEHVKHLKSAIDQSFLFEALLKDPATDQLTDPQAIEIFEEALLYQDPSVHRFFLLLSQPRFQKIDKKRIHIFLHRLAGDKIPPHREEEGIEKLSQEECHTVNIKLAAHLSYYIFQPLLEDPMTNTLTEGQKTKILEETLLHQTVAADHFAVLFCCSSFQGIQKSTLYDLLYKRRFYGALPPQEIAPLSPGEYHVKSLKIGMYLAPPIFNALLDDPLVKTLTEEQKMDLVETAAACPTIDPFFRLFEDHRFPQTKKLASEKQKMSVLQLADMHDNPKILLFLLQEATLLEIDQRKLSSFLKKVYTPPDFSFSPLEPYYNASDIAHHAYNLEIAIGDAKIFSHLLKNPLTQKLSEQSKIRLFGAALSYHSLTPLLALLQIPSFLAIDPHRLIDILHRAVSSLKQATSPFPASSANRPENHVSCLKTVVRNPELFSIFLNHPETKNLTEQQKLEVTRFAIKWESAAVFDSLLENPSFAQLGEEKIRHLLVLHSHTENLKRLADNPNAFSFLLNQPLTESLSEKQKIEILKIASLHKKKSLRQKNTALFISLCHTSFHQINKGYLAIYLQNHLLPGLPSSPSFNTPVAAHAHNLKLALRDAPIFSLLLEDPETSNLPSHLAAELLIAISRNEAVFDRCMEKLPLKDLTEQEKIKILEAIGQCPLDRLKKLLTNAYFNTLPLYSLYEASYALTALSLQPDKDYFDQVQYLDAHAAKREENEEIVYNLGDEAEGD